jgi:hypothetical protein
MSARSSAIAEMRTRLRLIRKVNGYSTDAGDHVFLGETPQLGPDDPDEAIAIVVGEDEPTVQGPKVILSLPVQVQAHVKVTAADPWMSVENLVADIKKAVETDHDLGRRVNDLQRGPVAPLEREDGSEVVGCGVEYRLVYAEKWGAP